jgi:hypothetical protein
MLTGPRSQRERRYVTGFGWRIALPSRHGRRNPDWAAAVVIFWPAAFFVGGDKQTAAELGQMKGQMVAIEQAANAKKCGIQFQGQRPPGT